MIPALTIDELVSIRKLMKSMLHEAVSGNWQNLELLDAQRRELLGFHMETSQENQVESPLLFGSSTNAKAYTALCQEITQLDLNITETVLNARKILVKENREIRNQYVAQKQYAQTATINASFYNQK